MKNRTELERLIETALNEDLCYVFDFEIKRDTIYCKNEFGYDIELSIDEEDVEDKDIVEQEIEEQMDGEANNIAEDGTEITGIEIVDFKYDVETKKGSFELVIFTEDEDNIDESLNESNMSYCRFRNTLEDLKDCKNALYNSDISSDEEAYAAKRLIEICKEIADNYEPEDAYDMINDEEDFDESLNEGKLWYIGWRSNPQLKNGGYWKKFGQLTKAEAKKWEKPGYGDMSLTGYETEEEYNKALKEKGLK